MNAVRFSIYLHEEQLKWLDEQAESEGLSRSKFIEKKIFPSELIYLKEKKGAAKGAKN